MSYQPFQPRYVLFLNGVNYAPADYREPNHAVIAETLDDARQLLLDAARGDMRALNGHGNRVMSTPGYGEPGDSAFIFRVPTDDPQFSWPINLDGDHARHAYAWLAERIADSGDPYPDYVATFGPRGGLTITRA